MKTPDQAGLELLSPLPPVGRAVTRHALGSGGELWRVDDAGLASKLERLGRLGLGRFGLSGHDERGAWLVRGSAEPTLSTWLASRERVTAREAAPLLLALAQCLERAEAESMFPGPLGPDTVTVRGPAQVELGCDPLVFTLVGAGAEASRATDASAGSPRWTPPEQAEGAPWNNAANRYVLGLIAYRMLAGEHPFAGRGLRLALEARAARPPPPFPPEVARELPAGLQALCLRLLDPTPAERPRSAGEIVARLRSLDAVGAQPAAGQRSDARPAPAARAEAKPRAAEAAASPSPKRALPAGALGLSLAGALGALLYVLLTRGEGSRAEPLAPRTPLLAATARADDCASCHPRQVGEWKRSVMAHSVKSPLFLALEMLIQEQVGRDFDCPSGAGILRKVDPQTACRDRASRVPVTGSGGEHWCVNCHAPAENLAPTVPAWDGRRAGAPNPTLEQALDARAMEGISCVFCHQVHGPVTPGALARGDYEGNPLWISSVTGRRFLARPEDARGVHGIANSGYRLDPALLFGGGAEMVGGGVHSRPSAEAKRYLGSSEFCGACHDVRLFGSDVIGVRERGEHFKRLRNAYSEWHAWAEAERRSGRTAASCQDCHMSNYPGVCVRLEPGSPSPVGGQASALDRACPPGTRFEAREPGDYPLARVATSSGSATPVRPHYFSGVDVPLAAHFPDELVDEPTVDTFGIPQGGKSRRDLLLAASVSLSLGEARRRGRQLELPVVIENVGAGHRIPAGFSQERELWVHLVVRDAGGRVVYEVGRVDRGDEDLRDKVFLRVNTDDRFTDGQGRPQGVFGADVSDGPDVPRWDPDPALGGRLFQGRGLVNFQNGFLRCVVCIGSVDSRGRCQPLPGQERTRADRYADGSYDIDTGECVSNLRGESALFETYFPVGALDASRGVLKAPDAIIDRRSLAPKQPVTFVYQLSVGTGSELTVEARLLFRAFPPFLLRAFIDYERRKRPSRPLIDAAALERLEVVELARLTRTIP